MAEANTHTQTTGTTGGPEFNRTAGVEMPDIDVRETIDGEDVGEPPHQDDGGSIDEPAQHETAAEPDVSAEKEARKAGWVGEEEWKRSHNGSLRGWKPATEYVEFRNHVLPLVQRELGREREARTQAENRLASLEAREREREKASSDAQQRIEIANLNIEAKDAAESQDWVRFNEVQQKIIRTVAEQAIGAKTAPKPNAVDPATEQAIREFGNQNKWLQEDKQLARSFAREMRLIIDTNTADNIADALEEAKREVMSRYRDHPSFRRNPERAMGEVGGTSTGMNGGSSYTIANAKQEWKDAIEYDLRGKDDTYKKEYLATWLAEARQNPKQYFRS